MFKRIKKFRTIILAVIATLLLIGSAIWIFDVPWQGMAEMLLVCLMFVVLIMAAASGLAYLVNRLRR